MNGFWKLFLSMSCSGGVVIAALYLGTRLWGEKLSRQWQYYLWLIAVLRLLVPFGPEASLLGGAYRALDEAVTATAAEAVPVPVTPPTGNESVVVPYREVVSPPAAVLPEPGLGPGDWAGFLWLAAALGLLLRKLTLYQSFVRYLKAGSKPVTDVARLDALALLTERAGVRRPVELWEAPLVSSPLLIGVFRPCIVLPRAGLPEKDFSYIVLHELTHCRRRDLLYKWLVQLTVCLHWFNPLVHLMSREAGRACELACDEAVLEKLGSPGDYGRTLLDAMAAAGRYREDLGGVTLSGNKELLKERIGAIMKYKKPARPLRALTAALTLAAVLTGTFMGVYTPAAASVGTKGTPPARVRAVSTGTGCASMAEWAYEDGSLPLFQMAFARLDAPAKSAWLARIYEDRALLFFGAALNLLEDDAPEVLRLAERVYGDGDIVYFSNLIQHMGEASLKQWLSRAMADGNWVFQSTLYDALGREDESDWDWDWDWDDAKDKAWAEAQTAEYGSVGVTVEGKNRYYRGQLVNVFLDMRANRSFYVLDMNPRGTVNIQITRDASDKITGVWYLSETEMAELFGDWDDEDDEPDEEETGRRWHPQIIPVNAKKVEKVLWLGDFALSEGDRVWYQVTAKTGKGLQVGFAKPGDAALSTVYCGVSNIRQAGEELACVSGFTVAPPVKPGTYRLFLRATDGPLGDVSGSVSIGCLAETD